MVLLRDNEQVPADLIVLSTSNADNICFVETKNLDGETNLKVRKPLKVTSRISSEEDLEHSHFYVDSEPPHANLYSFNGVLKYRPADSRSTELKQEAITINEMLLRGCALRNTKWIIGLVVFTGADTKIMLNGGETPSKRSKIEKETNFNVAMNFALLMVLCLVVALLREYFLWSKRRELMTDGYYVTLGSSADVYEIGARAAENIYLDSVIIFL
jgi:phospholipid-translocating ATPase